MNHGITAAVGGQALRASLAAFIQSLPPGTGMEDVSNALQGLEEQTVLNRIGELTRATGVTVVASYESFADSGSPSVESFSLSYPDGQTIGLYDLSIDEAANNAGILLQLGPRLVDGFDASDEALESDALISALEELYVLLHRLPRIRGLYAGACTYAIKAAASDWASRLPVPDAMYPNLALRNTYVIHSPYESAQDEDRPGFWSNQDGWGPIETATLFDADERYGMNLPLSVTGDRVVLERLIFRALPHLREEIAKVNASPLTGRPEGAVALELEGVVFIDGAWQPEAMDPQAFGLFVVMDDGRRQLVRAWEDYAPAYPATYGLSKDFGLDLVKAAGERDGSYLHYRNLKRNAKAS